MNESVRAFTAAGALVALSACAILDPHDYVDVSTHVDAPRGFTIEPSGIWRTGQGVEAHGWVCRRRPGAYQPTSVRIEKVGRDGEPLAAVSVRLTGVAAREGRCLIYSVKPEWSVADGDTLRICADSGSGRCQHAEPRPRQE